MPRRTTRTSAVKKTSIVKASSANTSSEVFFFDEEPLNSFVSPSKSMQFNENKENKRTSRTRKSTKKSSNSEKSDYASDKEEISKVRKKLRGKRRAMIFKESSQSQHGSSARVNVSESQEEIESLDDEVFIVSSSKTSQLKINDRSDISLKKDTHVMKTTPSIYAKSLKLKVQNDAAQKTPLKKLNRGSAFDKSDEDDDDDDDDVVFTRNSTKKAPILKRESTFDKTDDLITKKTPKLKREGTFDKTDSPKTGLEKPNTSGVAKTPNLIRQNTFDKLENLRTVDVPAYEGQKDSEILDSSKKVTVRKYKLTRQKVVLQSTPANKSIHKDLFDFVTNTPPDYLDKFMLMDGESVLLNNTSFGDETRRSLRRQWTKTNQTLEQIPGSPSIFEIKNTTSEIGKTPGKKPKLDRTNTFTIDEEAPCPETPLEGKQRKRWSQVEKTPVFGVPPPSSKKESILKKHKKSVLFASPPKSTPRPTKTKEKGSFIIDVTPIPKSLSNNDTSLINEDKLTSFLDKSDINISIANESMKGKKKSVLFASHNGTLPKSSLKSNDTEKERKSVKIETPLSTPKPRLHSPLVIRKTPMPKAADNSILSSNCAKPSSRTKMPNFQKIHEKRFEKMENIVDLQIRRAARAQQLLSGCKLIKKTDNHSPAEKETKKKLQFNDPKKDIKHHLPKPILLADKKIVSKPVQKMLVKRASLDKKKKEVKSKIPSRIPATKIIEKKVTTPRKEEAKKVMLTKTREVVNRKVENRNQMSNVRTNRRFELLMKMRNQNNGNQSTTRKMGTFLYRTKPNESNVHTDRLFPLEKRTSQAPSKIPIRIVNKAINKLTNCKILKNKSRKEDFKQIVMTKRRNNYNIEEPKTQLIKVRTNRRFELLMKMRNNERI